MPLYPPAGTFQGTVTADNFVSGFANPDGSTTFTTALFNPSIVQTTANDTQTVALRGLSAAPSVAAANTKNYTGSTGIVGVTAGPTITVGATGVAAAVHGILVTIANNANTTFDITNAFGIRVPSFSGTSGASTGYAYAIGGYFADQSNGRTGDIALLVGGSSVSPAISGSWSLFNQSASPSGFSASINFQAAAAGIVLKQGANGMCGTFVANGVTPVTISNTNVAITDAIIISLNVGGGTIGTSAPVVASITAGVGFTTKALALDISTYNYAIIKNAA